MSSVGIRVGRITMHELAGGLTGIEFMLDGKPVSTAVDLGKEYKRGTPVYRIEAGCGSIGPWIAGDPPTEVPVHSGCGTCAA